VKGNSSGISALGNKTKSSQAQGFSAIATDKLWAQSTIALRKTIKKFRRELSIQSIVEFLIRAECQASAKGRRDDLKPSTKKLKATSV